MTTDTLNHACSLKEEIDRLNELIERVKDKYFVRISFSRYTGVITNEYSLKTLPQLKVGTLIIKTNFANDEKYIAQLA